MSHVATAPPSSWQGLDTKTSAALHQLAPGQQRAILRNSSGDEKPVKVLTKRVIELKRNQCFNKLLIEQDSIILTRKSESVGTTEKIYALALCLVIHSLLLPLKYHLISIYINRGEGNQPTSSQCSSPSVNRRASPGRASLTIGFYLWRSDYPTRVLQEKVLEEREHTRSRRTVVTIENEPWMEKPCQGSDPVLRHIRSGPRQLASIQEQSLGAGYILGHARENDAS